MKASYPSTSSLPPHLDTLNRKQALSSNASSLEQDFEQYFKKNHPWQSVFVSSNIDKSIEEVSVFETKIF